MTSRVVNCRPPGARVSLAARPRRAPRPDPPAGGLFAAVLTSMVVVPLVGARAPEPGLLIAGATAAALLLLHRRTRGHAHWAWLTLLLAGLDLVVPLQWRPLVEPGLLVGVCVSGVVWLVQRVAASEQEPGRDRRPPPGSAAREAQEQLGRQGEQHVGAYLARELPDEFVLVNGLTLAQGAGDIDHLVIGPSGVFLLETKTMAGRIECRADGTWQRTRSGRRGGQYGAYIGDPAAQVMRNIHAVRGCLRTAVPSLFRGSPLWVEGLIVFPHPDTELATAHSHVPAVRLSEAPLWIQTHVGRRRLRPREVEAVLRALVTDTDTRAPLLAAQSAQALVEMVLALPVILALVFGVVGLSRLVQAQSSLVTLVHETARAGALGFDPADAGQRARQRADAMTETLGLDAGALRVDVDAHQFARRNGSVQASAEYQVDLADLPLIGWGGPIRLTARHVEWVDPFRSGLPPAGGDAP